MNGKVTPLETGRKKKKYVPALGCLEDRDARPLPVLTCLSQSTLRYVCITLCDTPRVPVPPSAKLNLSSPFSSARKRGAPLAGGSPSSPQTPPVNGSHPAGLCEGGGGAFKAVAPQSPVQLPCYCPLIHCSEGGGGWRGGVEVGRGGTKEPWALHIQDIEIWQLAFVLNRARRRWTGGERKQCRSARRIDIFNLSSSLN